MAAGASRPSPERDRERKEQNFKLWTSARQIQRNALRWVVVVGFYQEYSVHTSEMRLSILDVILDLDLDLDSSTRRDVEAPLKELLEAPGTPRALRRALHAASPCIFQNGFFAAPNSLLQWRRLVCNFPFLCGSREGCVMALAVFTFSSFLF